MFICQVFLHILFYLLFHLAEYQSYYFFNFYLFLFKIDNFSNILFLQKKLIMDYRIFLMVIVAFIMIKCTNDCESKKQTKNNCNEQEYLVSGTLWFQKSAEMRAIYEQSYNIAKMRIAEKMKNYNNEKPAAVVLDIDETVLDNSPFETHCINTGKGYTKESWKDWVDKEEAKPLPGVEDFLFFADSIGCEIFYISNRKTYSLGPSIKNMKNYNLPNADSAHILLKENTSSKVARRNKVTENHNIILFVGDNLTDFSEYFEDRSENYGFNKVDKEKEKFGDKYIILPNPMYGDWLKHIYNNSHKYTEIEKDSLRKSELVDYAN